MSVLSGQHFESHNVIIKFSGGGWSCTNERPPVGKAPQKNRRVCFCVYVAINHPQNPYYLSLSCCLKPIGPEYGIWAADCGCVLCWSCSRVVFVMWCAHCDSMLVPSIVSGIVDQYTFWTWYFPLKLFASARPSTKFLSIFDHAHQNRTGQRCHDTVMSKIDHDHVFVGSWAIIQLVEKPETIRGVLWSPGLLPDRE